MSNRYLGGFITASYNPLLVPNAPTIGTATSTVDTGSASITFTAPVNIGGSAITGYIAVARDSSSGVVFSATGTSSPITVTGLTIGNTYTLTVAAINSYGAGPASAASNSVTPAALTPGDALGGGYFAGKIVVSGITYNLVVAPKASGENSSKQYKTANSAAPSATITLNNGSAASASMNSATYPAAEFCEGLTIGGFSDWYLPSRDELELCYRNLKAKPAPDLNDTSVREKSAYTYPEGNDVVGDTMGVNRNSSPVGAAYTTTNPAQTSATAFRQGNSEALTVDYWTSTEFSSTQAWRMGMGSGEQVARDKNASFSVRAFRKILA